MITLFHNPSSQASIRAHTILKQAAGNAQSNATIDQASSHETQSKQQRTEFELGMLSIRYEEQSEASLRKESGH